MSVGCNVMLLLLLLMMMMLMLMMLIVPSVRGSATLCDFGQFKTHRYILFNVSVGCNVMLLLLLLLLMMMLMLMMLIVPFVRGLATLCDFGQFNIHHYIVFKMSSS